MAKLEQGTDVEITTTFVGRPLQAHPQVDGAGTCEAGSRAGHGAGAVGEPAAVSACGAGRACERIE